MLYPVVGYCAHCIHARDKMQSPVPPWPYKPDGWTFFPLEDWDGVAGSTITPVGSDMLDVAGDEGEETFGVTSTVEVSEDDEVEFRFSARSHDVPGILVIPDYWVDCTILPDNVLFTELRQYVVRFTAGQIDPFVIIGVQSSLLPGRMVIGNDARFRLSP